MSYLVLARKYRPENFASVAGQEQVTRTLRHAIERNRIAHAYLFTGPRGVGKTSIARIFSKALNCRQGKDGRPGPTTEPCGECASCVEIASGNGLAVREIDGASHNSVDNVRELIDSFRALPPAGSTYKVYIIDEVHMLSTAAFNALLKSLEEPPPHTVFILATTEVHKIPATVISRCQRHDLRALDADSVAANLASIAEREGLDLAPEALRMVVRLSEGSLRDAQSLLERVRAFSRDERITAHEVSQVLGVVPQELLQELTRTILRSAPGEALDQLQRVTSGGIDTLLLLREFVGFWRDCLIAKVQGEEGLRRFGFPKDEAQTLVALVQDVPRERLQTLVEYVRSGCDEIVRSMYAVYALEALVVRLATFEDSSTEKAIQTGGDYAAKLAPKVRAGRTSEKHETSARSEIRGSNAEYSWPAFVKDMEGEVSPFVFDFLKRLEITRFEAGVLEGRGSSLAVKTLEEPTARQKICQLLSRRFGLREWQISLNKVEGDAPPGSLVGQERARREAKKSATKDAARKHPAVQTLTQIFPGSMIEKIEPKAKGR